MDNLGLSTVVFAPGFNSQSHPGGTASFTDEEWIDAFYSSYCLWVLRVAEELLRKDPDCGFAVLLILFPYFEMIIRYREGKQSPNHEIGFRKGLYHVFSEKAFGDTTLLREKITHWLYTRLRCELAHVSFTGKGIVISGGFAEPIVWQLDRTGKIVAVGINPHSWAEYIRKDFEDYVAVLRDPSNKRERNTFLKYAKRHSK